MNTMVKDDTGAEQISDEDVVYQITTFGADYTVDGLINRFDRGDIYRPDFQRNFVWTLPQASKFVESILLGLPIPSVFLYRDEESQQHLIVDGLQRLTTLHGFFRGLFPGSDKAFRLKGVKSRFEDRTLQDLTAEDQRRFVDAVIHAMIIQQAAPHGDKSSVFHIFERLNSNGTPLQPQEIRAAIYHGPFQELLGHLNQNTAWRQMFGKVHKRSKDEELILRFLAFNFDYENYTSPMKLFLNNFMEKNQNFQLVSENHCVSTFVQTIEAIESALGPKAFRISRSLNAAIFDSFAPAVAKYQTFSPQKIQKAYERLLKDEKYLTFVSKATANEKNVEGRRKLAFSAVRDAA